MNNFSIISSNEDELSSNPTIQLLRLIGIPSITEMPQFRADLEKKEIYDLSIKNKISLLYLETLSHRGELNLFRKEYHNESKKLELFFREFDKAGKILNSLNISYAIFKTIRPYKVVPGDIDVIIFGKNKDYQDIQNAFLKASYGQATPDGPSRVSGDLMDPVKRIPIDLQDEIGVSYLIYMDKSNFQNNIVKKILPNGLEICAFTCDVDLGIIIMHSMIEQLYILGEFFTFMITLSNMNDEELSKFIKFLYSNHIVTAAKYHITITAVLCQAAYGFIPQKLSKLIDEIGIEREEIKRLIQSNFKMPYRYSKRALIRVFFEKRNDKKFRESFYCQLQNMVKNPKLAKFVIDQLIIRNRRDSYIKDYVKNNIKLSYK